MYNCLMTEKYQPEQPSQNNIDGHTVRDGCLKNPNFCEVFPAEEWKNVNLNKDKHHRDVLNHLATEIINPIRKFGFGDAYLISDLYEGSMVKMKKEVMDEHDKIKHEAVFYGIWSKFNNQEAKDTIRYLHLFELVDEKLLRFETSEAAMSLRYDIGKAKHLRIMHSKPEGYTFRLEKVTSLEILRIGFPISSTKEVAKQPFGNRLFPFLKRST